MHPDTHAVMQPDGRLPNQHLAFVQSIAIHSYYSYIHAYHIPPNVIRATVTCHGYLYITSQDNTLIGASPTIWDQQ